MRAQAYAPYNIIKTSRSGVSNGTPLLACLLLARETPYNQVTRSAGRI